MVTPYFMGHENPATIFRFLKLTHSSLRDMVGDAIPECQVPCCSGVEDIGRSFTKWFACESISWYLLTCVSKAGTGHVDKGFQIHARKPRL